MPRYFFDLYNDMVPLDEEGTVLPDAAAAQDRALAEAREMIAASVKDHRRIDLMHCIEVRDAAGEVLDRVLFERAVSFVRDGKPV
jgi:hypothetical protein